MVKYYNIDGLELLQSLSDKSIDFILTDPPYELNIEGGAGKNFRRRLTMEKHISYISKGFDYERWFNEFERVCKTVNMVIFCSNKQISKIISFWENKGYAVTLLVWYKPNAIPLLNNVYHSNLEFMVYVRGNNAVFNNQGYEYQSKLFNYPYPHQTKRIHPTEKPLPLLRRLLLIHTNKNDVVLDPFAGSFSTGIACYELNRNCIMAEIDTEMFNKAKVRIEKKIAQLKLF